MRHVPMFGSFVGPARRWFAWRPTRLFDGTWVWLITIERQRVQLHDHLSGGPGQWWFYCKIGDQS